MYPCGLPGIQCIAVINSTREKLLTEPQDAPGSPPHTSPKSYNGIFTVFSKNNVENYKATQIVSMGLVVNVTHIGPMAFLFSLTHDANVAFRVVYKGRHCIMFVNPLSVPTLYPVFPEPI